MPDERRIPISLGDVVLAKVKLRPDDQRTARAIDELLGMERSSVTAPPLARPSGPWKSSEQPAIDAPPPFVIETTLPREPLPPADPIRLQGTETSREFVGRVPFQAPDWAADNEESFKPAAGSDASLPPPPLFAGLHERAVLSATLATSTDGSEIDTDALTITMTEGRRLETIPFRQTATLRRGAHILIDLAPTMDPIRDDIATVRAGAERLLGGGRAAVWYFAFCPSARESDRRGVWDGPHAKRVAWRAPARGVPVLVISDFTLSPSVDDEGYARVGEWVEFAADVRAAGCPLVGLTPFPPTRWPPALDRLITFVHWSERTTARQVMQAVRERAR